MEFLYFWIILNLFNFKVGVNIPFSIENFSIENGLMTPTMKVKRKKVTEKYKIQLENLY